MALTDVFGLLFALLLIAVVLALIFVPPFWVYSDARKRGSSHPLALGILVFIVGPLGALIYYFLRHDIGSKGRRGTY